MRSSFYFLLLGLIFNCSTPTFAGTKRVYLPVPLNGTSLGKEICFRLGALLSGEPEGKPHVYLAEEEFRPDPYQTDLLIPTANGVKQINDLPFGNIRQEDVDRLVPQELVDFAKNLTAARRADGQKIPGDRASLLPYANFTEAQFGVRYGENPTAEHRLVMTPFQGKPYWFLGDEIGLNPHLASATEATRGVEPVDRDQVLGVIPEPVLRQMLQYSLADEMVAGPHHASARSRYYGLNDKALALRFELPRYFLVNDPTSGERLGYMISLDAVETDHNTPLHSGLPAYDRATRFRKLAHFDLYGNRVEAWETGALVKPLGKHLIQKSITNLIVEPHGDRDLYYERPQTRQNAGQLVYSEGEEETLLNKPLSPQNKPLVPKEENPPR